MIDPAALQNFLNSDRVTDREREAAHLVFTQHQGFNRAARQLGISPRAVRGRLDNLLRKLRAVGLDPTTLEAEHHPEHPGIFELTLWLRQRETRIAHTPTNDEGHHPNDPRPAGDAHQLRGIPVIGVPGGIGGTWPADRPGHQHAVQRANQATQRTTDQSVRYGQITYRQVRL